MAHQANGNGTVTNGAGGGNAGRPPVRKTRVDRLPCGMKLLTRENRTSGVATVDVWVRTGSADETPEVGGISHFLEHMLFKGTDRYATGEIEREIESVGGVSNAGTSYDFTHYYVTLPAENVGKGIEIISEMVRRSELDEKELEKERLVILEEWRRKQDNPAAMLYEDVYEYLYRSGPYHLPVIGTEETIRSITRAQMADYYRRHYTPDNMVLIVNGDVDTGEVIDHASAAFADFDRALDPLLKSDGGNEIGPAGAHHRERHTGGELYYCLACAAPSVRRIDLVAPLDVAEFMLGQGRASRLVQEIREKRRLVSTIGTYYATHRHESIFLVSATCEPGKRDELGAALREELGRFAEEKISDEELRRAKRLLASAHLFSFETTGSTSGEIGYYHTLTGGTEFTDTYLERLDAVTARDAQEAFRTMTSASDWLEVTVGPAA